MTEKKFTDGPDPSKIMNLLIEAANPLCFVERRDAILDELLTGIDDTEGLNSQEAAEQERIGETLRHLYNRCTDYNPSILPSFYPLFALFAKHHHEEWYAKIDWKPFESWQKIVPPLVD